MLIIWMQDMIHRHVPLSGLAIRQQTLGFYSFVEKNLAVHLMKLLLRVEVGSIDSEYDSPYTMSHFPEKKPEPILKQQQHFLRILEI